MESVFQPCPACPNIIELRARDFLRFGPPTWTCGQCKTKLGLDYRKKGGELYIPAVVLVLTGFFLGSRSNSLLAPIGSWELLTSLAVAIVITRLLVARYGRSRMRLETVERIKSTAECPYCHGVLRIADLRPPWRISCPHCSKRLGTTWAGHFWMLYVSGFIAWVGLRSLEQLGLATQVYWPLAALLAVTFYFLVAPTYLRVRKPARA